MSERGKVNIRVLRKLKARASREGLDALLLTNGTDIKYLLGPYIPGTFILVRVAGEPLFFVDGMNRTLAEKTLPCVGIELISSGQGRLRDLSGCSRKYGIKKIGIDSDTVTMAFYAGLKSAFPKNMVIPYSSEGKGLMASIRLMREIKSPGELKLLKKAAKETISIWKSLRRELKYGMTEKEIAMLTDRKVLDKGYENSFPTIAAVGRNSAFPHAIPAGTRIVLGKHLVLDFGLKVKGYCSDLTRTWYKGRIDRQIMDFHTAVRYAQDLAIMAIRPGAVINATVNKVNNFFKDNGLGEFVLHGLGHGVGLDVHERPFVNGRNPQRFKEGMVVAIEPGLYRKGKGGVRVEDMVRVNKNGCEVLTR